MARKKKQEEHVNHERWLVSYADFITLLFAFFVVMYSVSSVNEGKYRVLSDALMSAFHSTPKSLEPIQVGQPSKSPVMSQLQYRSNPSVLIMEKKGVDYSDKEGSRKLQDDRIYQSQQGDSELGKIANSVSQAMAELIKLGVINVRRRDNWVEIEIKNSILFNSGSAKLKSSVIPVLQDLGSLLSRFPNSIKIEGYTDSDRIATDQYPSNWELSAARAASIVRVFELANMLPERMSVVGYGDTRPVADNSTAEGKAENRRVVIMIMANNDAAGTVHKATEATPDALPSEIELKDAGLVDTTVDKTADDSTQQSSTDIGAQANQPSQAEAGDQSLLQRPLPAPPPGKKPSTGDQAGIVTPLISPPIRLFRPIDLPLPLDRSENEAPARSEP